MPQRRRASRATLPHLAGGRGAINQRQLSQQPQDFGGATARPGGLRQPHCTLAARAAARGVPSTSWPRRDPHPGGPWEDTLRRAPGVPSAGSAEPRHSTSQNAFSPPPSAPGSPGSPLPAGPASLRAAVQGLRSPRGLSGAFRGGRPARGHSSACRPGAAPCALPRNRMGGYAAGGDTRLICVISAIAVSGWSIVRFVLRIWGFRFSR